MRMTGEQNNQPTTDLPAAEELQVAAPVPQWRPQDADREAYKNTIRKRVWNARVTEGTVFKPAKPRPRINDDGKKRVAVYARVSTKSTEQVSSIENQTRYYTEKIGKTPNWQMQRIYSDEGKSGTSTRHRTNFQQMIQDARDQQMDLILCASVSRFARNISDCITMVRKLRTENPSHPVGVYFETENIYTLDPESNNALSIHAMLAEWESANKSRRMILSYDQRICTGQYQVCDLLGFRHTVDGDLIIQEEEAKTVRFAYLARFVGMRYEHVASILTEKQRPTLQGRTEWNESMVRSLLKNERRWGDLSARKTIVIDYAEKKIVRNVGERDAAYVTGHHQGIVSSGIARAVQMVDASSRKTDGVRELGVVETGGLKGFISVSPSWSGVDNDTFQELCKSVYDENAFEQLQHVAGIRAGNEHTNMRSFTFNGYEVAPSAYFIGNSTPTLTFGKRYIKFNKAFFKKLGNCEYIEVLYHPVLQAIVVRSCNKDAVNAISTSKLVGDRAAVPMPAPAFSAAVYEKMNWLPEYDFRFRGIYRERDGARAIAFYLDEPQILVGKHARELTEQYPINEAGTACYIPYKGRAQIAYPMAWEKHPIGMNYELRKCRDQLVDTLTAADITSASTVVENPLIGRIPSRQEVLDEIEQLLISM